MANAGSDSTNNASRDGTEPISSPDPDVSAAQKRKADQLEDSEEQPTIKLVEVDPNGDLIFRVGAKYTEKSSNPLDIKVNRNIMSLGSPVFAKMLSGGFLEAQAGVIDLFEDNPTSFLEYCKILHHKTTNLSQLSETEILELVTIADMRGSQSVLRPWMFDCTQRAYTHLREALLKSLTSGSTVSTASIKEFKGPDFSIETLVEIAATFNHPEYFWDATRSFFANIQNEIDPSHNSRERSLPAATNPNGHEICGKIVGTSILPNSTNCRPELIMATAQAYRMEMLAEWFACASRCLKALWRSKIDPTCQFKKHGTLTMFSEDAFGKKDSTGGRHRSVMATLKIFATFTSLLSEDGERQGPISSILRSECTMKKSDGENCAFCKRDFHKDFNTLVEEQKQKVRGVCLTCFRTGKKDIFTTREHALDHCLDSTDDEVS